jgi:hypothetical protein
MNEGQSAKFAYASLHRVVLMMPCGARRAVDLDFNPLFTIRDLAVSQAALRTMAGAVTPVAGCLALIDQSERDARKIDHDA